MAKRKRGEFNKNPGETTLTFPGEGATNVKTPAGLCAKIDAILDNIYHVKGV